MKELYEKWSKRRYIISRKLSDKPIIRVGITRSSFYIKTIYLVSVYEKAKIRSEINRKVLERVSREKDVKLAYPHIKAVIESENSIKNT